MSNSIVLGAGGHASEVLDILVRQIPESQISFFNNTVEENYTLFDKFKVFCAKENLNQFNTFYLGVGNSKTRKFLSSIALQAGLVWKGVRSETATIARFQNKLHETVDVMDYVMISSKVTIGKGVLLNRAVNIHHDVVLGNFCEIAPGAQILGNVQIAENVFIGAGAVILPKVKIGANSIIGAGSVVTKDIATASTVVGVPARKISI